MVALPILALSLMCIATVNRLFLSLCVYIFNRCTRTEEKYGHKDRNLVPDWLVPRHYWYDAFLTTIHINCTSEQLKGSAAVPYSPQRAWCLNLMTHLLFQEWWVWPLIFELSTVDMFSFTLWTLDGIYLFQERWVCLLTFDLRKCWIFHLC